MECGDLSPLFGEGFSLHNLTIDPDENGVPVGVEPVPPIHAIEARLTRPAIPTSDIPCRFTGHDKRAPPCFEGTCLSGPFQVLREVFPSNSHAHFFLPEQCGEIKNPVKSVTYVGNHGVLDIYCGLRLSGLEPETYGLKVHCPIA